MDTPISRDRQDQVQSRRKQSPRRVQDALTKPERDLPRLTLRQLARLTPTDVQERGLETAFIRVTNLKTGSNDVGAFKLIEASILCEKLPHLARIMVYYEPGVPPENADQIADLLRAVPGGPILWNKPVWLTCDCEYWLYNCEVAVHHFGSTDIIKSNGEYPHQRNPTLKPHLCKHLWALAPLAVKSTRGPRKNSKGVAAESHPVHRGRLPNHLRNHLQRRELTPTQEEVRDALNGVRNFL